LWDTPYILNSGIRIDIGVWGYAKLNSKGKNLIQLPRWNDLQLFLQVARSGSFSQAAELMGISQPTISRRIETMEKNLKMRLFDRLPTGSELTSDGMRIVDAAQRIDTSFSEFNREVNRKESDLKRVRISVTDGLATKLISAHMPNLFKKIPNLRIDLQCSVVPLDVIRFETDLSIRFKRPVQSRIVAAKLGTLHFLPFASAKYLAEHGTPKNLEDLQSHNILDHESYFDDDGDWSDWKKLLGDTHRIVYRTNSSMALLEAVEQGVGIGLLPTYVSTFTKAEMLDIGFHTESEIWLCYDERVRQSLITSAVAQWLKELFRQTGRPWFRDKLCLPQARGR